MIIVLAIGMFCASIYMLLSGLTVKQREIALTLRKAKRYGTRDQREIETRRSVRAISRCLTVRPPSSM